MNTPAGGNSSRIGQGHDEDTSYSDQKKAGACSLVTLQEGTHLKVKVGKNAEITHKDGARTEEHVR